MMTFNKFKETIDLLVSQYKIDRSAYELGVSLIEYSDSYHKIITNLWSEILTKEGVEWLEWFLYEKDYISGNPRADFKAFQTLDSGEQVEIVSTLQELYDYLIKNNYFNA